LTFTTPRGLRRYTVFSGGFSASYAIHRILFDKNPPGWILWNDSISLYKLPHTAESTFQPWEAESADAIDAIREIVTDSKYWEDLAVYYSEENHETTVIQDDISCVKSICEPASFKFDPPVGFDAHVT